MHIKAKKVGPESATFEPVTLRETSKSRLVFKPTLVHNQKDEHQPVTGTLVWQAKKPSESQWTDETDLKLTQIESGSGVQLNLSPAELFLLTMAVRGLYGFYYTEKRLPYSGEEIDLEQRAREARSHSTANAELGQLIAQHGADAMSAVLKWAGSLQNVKSVIDHLQSLEVSDIANLGSLAGLAVIKRVLHDWDKDSKNDDESYWQKMFQAHSFVLSQVFSALVVLLQGQAHLGGTNISGRGEKEADFLLSNAATNHVAIVEIKTPAANLLMKEEYRSTYRVSSDVTGALVQTLVYRDTLVKSFFNKKGLKTELDPEFQVAEPHCILVIGTITELDSGRKRHAFELFRRSQRFVDIITFDELYLKMKMLVELLEGNIKPESW